MEHTEVSLHHGCWAFSGDWDIHNIYEPAEIVMDLLERKHWFWVSERYDENGGHIRMRMHHVFATSDRRKLF